MAGERNPLVLAAAHVAGVTRAFVDPEWAGSILAAVLTPTPAWMSSTSVRGWASTTRKDLHLDLGPLGTQLLQLGG